ncbi:MAG TPA: hypothetical protein VEU29_04725 [Actinomycetota bacterium]|nr:hypothetical protein [Actinomycetota bacterium]
MGSAKRFAAAAAATAALTLLSGPVAAHEREFKWVYGASISDEEIKTQAELTTGKHPGTVRMTLKKKVDGKWVFVKAKAATYGDDGYYTAMFSMLGGEKCKVWAKHTAKGHKTIKKAGNWFSC